MELVTRNHIRRVGRGTGGTAWRGTKYTPVIGLSFISNARSLLASCHSLVRVFGGGAATIKRVHPNRHKRKEGSRTELFKSEEKHACDADEGECAEEDLEVVAGLAGGCAWAVRAKGYVICCLWGINTSFSVRSFVRSGGDKTRQGRETGQRQAPSKPQLNTTTSQQTSNQSKN